MQRRIINLICPIAKWVSLSRTLRPSVKIGKEKFQVTIDVRSFNRDEIRVKAHTDYIVIEGKQERKMKNGCVIRQFIRRFKLPEGCSPSNIESKLSQEGVLTVTAKRSLCDKSAPCETTIPIKFSGPLNDEAAFVPVQESCKNICDSVMKKAKKKPDNP